VCPCKCGCTDSGKCKCSKDCACKCGCGTSGACNCGKKGGDKHVAQ
jgi:hypothetical protein